MYLRVLVVLALLTAFAAAAAGADAAFKFGSKLDSTVQPSNAETAHWCDPQHRRHRCTWVMNEAYGRPDSGHRAPRRGTIIRIRLIAGEAGSFRLQIVRAHGTVSGFEGKAVRNGPVIRYKGQPDPDEPYLVESFSVRIPIRKGDRLAIKTRRTSTLRCSSGGPNTLLFYPPLTVGAGFRSNTGDDGCWLLLEAVVRPAS
jgi:hypothetical protein